MIGRRGNIVLVEFLNTHNLEKKWEKAKRFFEENIRHQSLHTELLEPHWHGFYRCGVGEKTSDVVFYYKGRNGRSVCKRKPAEGVGVGWIKRSVSTK